jgi:hypothetical protein
MVCKFLFSFGCSPFLRHQLAKTAGLERKERVAPLSLHCSLLCQPEEVNDAKMLLEQNDNTWRSWQFKFGNLQR